MQLSAAPPGDLSSGTRGTSEPEGGDLTIAYARVDQEGDDLAIAFAEMDSE